jgi:hypothetical protein
MTDPVQPSAEQPTPAGSSPLPAQKRKYQRKPEEPGLSSNPGAPPLPTKDTTVETPAPVVQKPARRARRARKPETVKVVLTGNFKGFHAFEPSIHFTPGIPVTVPHDGWIKAQLDAKYLKKV